MSARREPGATYLDDLFHNTKDGSPSALARRIEAEGRDRTKVKRWRARWVDHEGKMKSKSFERKADATKFLKSVAADLVKGHYLDRNLGKVTVSAVYEMWLPSRTFRAEKTKSNQASIWTNHVEERWGDVEVSRIKKSEVQHWVAELHENGNGHSLIRQAVGALKMVMDYAVDDGRLLVNPVKDVAIPPDQAKERYYLTVPQVETLADAIGAHYSTLIRVLSYVGPRFGEISALRVMDVDLANMKINIVKAFSDDRGKRVEKDTKNHERRSVKYTDVLHEEIAALVSGRPGIARVFTTEEGAVLSPSNFRNRHFIPAREAAEEALGAPLPPVKIRELRNTAVSLAISSGANVKAVQRMVGHKSAALTLDTYADLFDDDLEEVAVKMSEKIRRERTSS